MLQESYKNNIDFNDEFIVDPMQMQLDNYEILQQIELLEHDISKTLASYRILSQETQIIQSKLDVFTNEYNSQVGGLYEELRTISSIMEASVMLSQQSEMLTQNIECDEYEAPSDEPVFSSVSEPEIQLVDNEIKNLYRRLAKAFHPDMTNNDEIAAEMFRELQVSYANNDLEAMIRIEQLFFGEVHVDGETIVGKLERLEQQHSKLHNDLDILKMQRYAIENSSEYKLQQRVRWRKMCGEDLISIIKQKTMREIEVKKQILALTSH